MKMKIKLMIVLFVCFLGIKLQAQTDSTFKTPYYKQRVAYFNKEAVPKHHIVFLGNSITEVGKWQALISN